MSRSTFLCYVGIDLGSTTTKSVVVDDQGEIIGRGITNSRSNYDLACEIARSEAFVDAQMNRLRKALAQNPVLESHAKVLSASLERSFRYRQHARQLESLRRACMEITRGAQPLEGALVEILDELDALAEKMFSGIAGAEKRSEFFRDIAGAQFQKAAETRADPKRLPFEDIVAVFDKAILKVENERDDLTFEGNARAAFSRSLGRYGKATPEVQAAAASVLDDLLERPPVIGASVGTGYGRARLPFPKERIRSEILCHGLGAHAMFPNTRTVLDIGGQDTKAIQVDQEGIVTGFQMNDRCAAGCGRYLGYIADEMNLGVHELGPLAEQATRKVKISSTCTVFAGAELRDRLALGEKREDILAGLHRAIILRAMSILARSGGVHDEFTFTGGVANNPAAVRALKDLIAENYGARILNISPSSIYTGALGAALFALRDARRVEEEAARPKEIHA
ncbi:MAG: BadF/BadG/BcrA/BcrD ATPase family protein [Byssovorax sp.]